MTKFNTEEYLLARIKTYGSPLYVKVEPNLSGDGSHTLVVHKANNTLNSVALATSMPDDLGEDDDEKRKELADHRFNEALIALGFAVEEAVTETPKMSLFKDEQPVKTESKTFIMSPSTTHTDGAEDKTDGIK